MSIPFKTAMAYKKIGEKRKQASENLTGLYTATVVANGEEKEPINENLDKAKLGRIRVRVHNIHDKNTKISDCPWADYCSPYGGFNDVGFFFIPPVGSIVYVMFIGGIPSAPVWVGTRWSLGESPRATYNDPKTVYPKNNVIRTPSGITIELDDSKTNAGIRITSAAGNFVSIDDFDKQTINVSAEGDVNITSNGNINLRGKELNMLFESIKVEAKEDINIASQNLNSEYNHTHKGDTNVVEGNFKMHQGSVAVTAPGHIETTGKISSDSDIICLGNAYIHGRIVADHSIYTKERIYDNAKYNGSMGLLYTDLSSWFRLHQHIETSTFLNPIGPTMPNLLGPDVEAFYSNNPLMKFIMM
jgi:hypothetical protein